MSCLGEEEFLACTNANWASIFFKAYYDIEGVIAPKRTTADETTTVSYVSNANCLIGALKDRELVV
jgi:hypothetical protein